LSQIIVTLCENEVQFRTCGSALVVPNFLLKLLLEAVHKRRRNQGEGNLFIAGISRIRGERGSSDADVRTFWCKKLQRTRRRGLNLFGHFSDKEKGIIFFAILRGRLYGWPLMLLH